MPSYKREISIPGRSAAELYQGVSGGLEKMLSKFNVPVKFTITRNDPARSVEMASPVFNATISCVDGRVTVDGSISFLAMPFKPKIDAGIDQWIAKADKHLPPKAAGKA